MGREQGSRGKHLLLPAVVLLLGGVILASRLPQAASVADWRFLVGLAAPPSEGLAAGETPITSSKSLKTDLAMYGNIVVWVDDRNGNHDIYMVDLSTGQESPVTTAPGDQQHPAIYGNIVVWQDSRNGNWDIYMKNLTTGEESPVTTAPDSQMFPAIHGNIVVWEDYRNRGAFGMAPAPDIYRKDLSTGQEYALPISPERQVFKQERPKVYGNRLFWVDYSVPPIGEEGLFWLDLSTGQANLVAKDWRYAVYGDRVVPGPAHQRWPERVPGLEEVA